MKNVKAIVKQEVEFFFYDIDSIPVGTVVTVTAHKGHWYDIQTADGQNFNIRDTYFETHFVLI